MDTKRIEAVLEGLEERRQQRLAERLAGLRPIHWDEIKVSDDPEPKTLFDHIFDGDYASAAREFIAGDSIDASIVTDEEMIWIAAHLPTSLRLDREEGTWHVRREFPTQTAERKARAS